MWAGSAIAAGLDAGTVGAAAAGEALAALADAGAPAGADAALVLATAAWGAGIDEVAAVASEALGVDGVGASVFGLLHAGAEYEQNPVVGVMALAGFETEGFLVEGLGGDEGRAGEEIADGLRAPLGPEDVVVAFPDGDALVASRLLEGLQRELAPARLLGVGATGHSPGRARVWRGGEVASGALSGLVLRLPEAARFGVAQAAHLVAEPMRVTRSRGNWILGLDGRPALDVYREVARDPLASDLHRAARSLVLAIPEVDCGELDLDRAPLRDITGFDLERRALGVPRPVPSGTLIAIAHLDARAARENLASLLAELAGPPAAFGLYCGCRTRGAKLFGHEGLEAGYLARTETPLLGVTGPYQIAPLGPSSRPALLTRAGVLVLAGSRAGKLSCSA